MKLIAQLLFLFLFTVALSACIRNSPNAVAAEIVKAKPVDVSVHRQGKPSLNVRLRYPQQKIPINKPALLDLSLLTPVREGALAVTVHLAKGLTLIKGKTQKTISLPKTHTLALPLTVKVAKPGKYYVYLQTHLQGADNAGIHSRSLVAIIWAGNSTSGHLQKTSSESQEAASHGASIIEMPGQETRQ